ncbi:hypothetical protein FVE85_5295 [Porphyridium purpureum]|uniref:Uncharacterized protein n=1 Tax=Porphyridium purpureum TaxID=35688 RepID=A0A5J4Z357_PORPP|nr:hypothetical protein FVE85_5295 [Porphyridium purpureum]|eukprot:POR0916..scf295_1
MGGMGRVHECELLQRRPAGAALLDLSAVPKYRSASHEMRKLKFCVHRLEEANMFYDTDRFWFLKPRKVWHALMYDPEEYEANMTPVSADAEDELASCDSARRPETVRSKHSAAAVRNAAANEVRIEMTPVRPGQWEDVYAAKAGQMDESLAGTYSFRVMGRRMEVSPFELIVAIFLLSMLVYTFFPANGSAGVASLVSRTSALTQWATRWKEGSEGVLRASATK